MLTITAIRRPVVVTGHRRAATTAPSRRRPGTIEAVGRHLLVFLAVVTTGMGAFTLVEGRQAPVASTSTAGPVAPPPAAPALRR